MAVHLIAEVLQVRLTCQVGRAAPGAGHEGAEAEHTASFKTLSGFTPNKLVPTFSPEVKEICVNIIILIPWTGLICSVWLYCLLISVAVPHLSRGFSH